MKWYKWLDLYYLESVRNDATVFPDISKENISAKIPTRCFSGTLPHSLTRTCSLFWGWLPFSGNKGRIWEFVPQKHWLTFEGVLFFYLIRGRKMHPFLFDQSQMIMIPREVKVPFQFLMLFNLLYWFSSYVS